MNVFKLLVGMLFSLVLVACGGGGGSAASSVSGVSAPTGIVTVSPTN